MKKLLFIMARLPYPPVNGQKNVLYNYCRILHEVYSYEITVASFLESGDAPEPKPDFIHRVVVLPNVSARSKIANLVRYTMILGKFPMQVSLYWSSKIRQRINALAEQIKPDILVADMVRTTEYLHDLKAYRIASLTDLLSVRYRRQFQMDIGEVNPYGAFLYTLPKSAQRIVNAAVLKKWVLHKEIRLLERYERAVGRLFERTIFVSQNEADALNAAIGEKRAVCVPLGVDVEYLAEVYRKWPIEGHTIAFLGAMNVAHNEAAVTHFVRDILPEILLQEPDVVLRVVGGGVTDRLMKLASPHVTFTGRVDDVRPHVASCRVFVCPLQFGSGIKTKILEAMAMGVPVVTTSIGAENIDARDGEDWLVADDNLAFSEAVVALLRDDALYGRLQTNGEAFVRERFSWKVAERLMLEALPSDRAGEAGANAETPEDGARATVRAGSRAAQVGSAPHA